MFTYRKPVIDTKTKPGDIGCGLVALLVIGLGLLLLGLGMLRNTVRPYLSYQETTCQILDKKLDLHLSTPTRSRIRPKSSIHRTSLMYQPMITFTYKVGGRSYKARGYSGVDVSSGSREAEQSVLDAFILGESYPCWYDPEHPAVAMLARGTWWELAYTAFPLAAGLLCLAGALSVYRMGTEHRPLG